jgi:hypothetical protein
VLPLFVFIEASDFIDSIDVLVFLMELAVFSEKICNFAAYNRE